MCACRGSTSWQSSMESDGRAGSDLRRIYTLWESQQIDGMYSLARLDSFGRISRKLPD